MVATLDSVQKSQRPQSAELWKSSVKQQQHKPGRQPISHVAVTANMLVEDAVHGRIELPSYIEEIVKHGLFQRLKDIQQLGMLPWAEKPHATHTRYDHCIGTYKSAQNQLDALKINSNYEPELPEWCRLAVEIAALLHDVGHGPFSHSWENVCGHDFNHEENGLICVDRIFDTVTSPELLLLRDNRRGVNLIKALIVGKIEQLQYSIRGHEYIFDIVHNKLCGVDVDKWDYLRRDNLALNVLTHEEMQFNNVFLKARISPDGRRIEYRFEDYHLIYKLFNARHLLHLKAYRLPKSLGFDTLLKSIVRKHAPHLLDVTAEEDDWLNLVDRSVFKEIEDHPLTFYLKSPECWQKTLTCKDIKSCIHVRNEKVGPGLDMKSDDSFAFYGDISQKRSINRVNTSTFIEACYNIPMYSDLVNSVNKSSTLIYFVSFIIFIFFAVCSCYFL